MDDLATRPRPPRTERLDIAAIVLGDPPARRRGGHDRRLGGVTSGYEARSVLVLAIVVALLAGVVGWAMHVGRDAAAPASVTQPAPAAGARASAQADPAPVVADPRVEDTARPAAAPGVDLGIGRIVASRTATGGGVVRVVVANRGSRPLRAASGAQLLVLLDGQVVAERAVGDMAAGSSLTEEVRLDACPAARHAVVAVIDPRAAVAELDERDNATTRTMTFDC